jgi:hypothetical protein
MRKAAVKYDCNRLKMILGLASNEVRTRSLSELMDKMQFLASKSSAQHEVKSSETTEVRQTYTQAYVSPPPILRLPVNESTMQFALGVRFEHAQETTRFT